jgi:hypothetical protein
MGVLNRDGFVSNLHIKGFKVIDKNRNARFKTLTVGDQVNFNGNVTADLILPKSSTSTIGTLDQKFGNIYAHDIFIDMSTIHFGDIALSTTEDGDFFCTVDGETKSFKFEGINEAVLNSSGKIVISDSIRDVPGNGLPFVYYNPTTHELSYDSKLPSYSDLVDRINTLEATVAELQE